MSLLACWLIPSHGDRERNAGPVGKEIACFRSSSWLRPALP